MKDDEEGSRGLVSFFVFLVEAIGSGRDIERGNDEHRKTRSEGKGKEQGEDGRAEREELKGN